MVGTMVGGAIVLRTPMLFALGFIVQFLVGGLSGIYVASPPLDYHVHDSYFVVAHFHYTLLGGQRLRAVRGRLLLVAEGHRAPARERLGRCTSGSSWSGTNLTFIPQFVLGYDGMPRRMADYSPAYGWAALNTVSTVGAGIVALSVAGVPRQRGADEHRRQGRPAPDPWEGQTLEWATTSPPPRHNFTARCRPSAPTRRCSTCARRRSCEERRPGGVVWARAAGGAGRAARRCGRGDLWRWSCCRARSSSCWAWRVARRARARPGRAAWCPRRARAACWPRAGSRCWPLGAVAGLWAALIGAGLLVLAIVAAVRERGRVSGAVASCSPSWSAPERCTASARGASAAGPPWRGACFAAGLAALGRRAARARRRRAR